MNNTSVKSKLHTARVVASFALLGAVFFGVIFGGLDVDLRPWGAALGAGGAIAMKMMHIL
jgi:hypothetical protein